METFACLLGKWLGRNWGVSAETGSGARAKAGPGYSLPSHALQPGEDTGLGTGTLTFTASRHPEEGLQDRAELRLHFMSLSRIGEIYAHSLVFERAQQVCVQLKPSQFSSGLG